ncbi:MAG: Hpt domain-containing protein, partial [Proteobacteria bacterium]|nr:Hpt domain-containing protein [Pseudomonadota bacterium]
MSDHELDFDADELAMLRQLFRDEANDALETVTTRVLASGSTRPSAEALTEMMRVTHTLKGAAGTVGLHVMVDLSHRFEDALAKVGKGAPWTLGSADLIVEITDGLRAYLERVDHDPLAAGDLAREVRDRVERLGNARQPAEVRPVRPSEPPPILPGGATAARTAPSRPSDLRLEVQLPPASEVDLSPGDSLSMAIPTIVEAAGDDRSGPIVRDPAIEAPRRRSTRADSHGDLVSESKSYLRVEPERIDALMSSAGELLFDRTRIERRVQLLRTLARDLARTRQTLRDALGPEGNPSRAAIAQTETELASQATLLSQTTAALLDEIEALRRTIGELQRGLTRIRMESARKLMSHAARTLRALHRATGVRVELRTVGEDTEFDKAVAEQLVDPITQLLRNAIAHGVEPPAERLANGKPAIATITIRARQDGNLLVLELADD